MRRLLFLIDQPWQLELATSIVAEMGMFGSDFECALALTDYYTFTHHPRLISSIKFEFIEQVFTLESEYRRWQSNNLELADEEYLQTWEQNFCKSRNLDALEKTNQWVYGDERSRYYLPLSNHYRRVILSDTVKWVDCILESWKPSIIVSIERSTLPTNLFWARAEAEKINFLTFIPSRIGNRWSLRDDFGYGMNASLEQLIRDKYSQIEMTDEAAKLIGEIVSEKKGSYKSLEAAETISLIKKSSNPFQSLIGDLFDELKRIYSRIFFEIPNRAFPVRRVEQHLLKLSLVRLQKVFIQFLFHLGLYSYAHKSLPGTPYYFWGLHARPEGSVLALGDGRDEIEQLLEFANLLPNDSVVVVKENIEMFGLRKLGFYRNLSKNPKIWLLEATSNTFEAILLSKGVIGISGTILLEAKMLKKRVCALGNPEFLPFLDYSRVQIQDFIENPEVNDESFTEFLKYVQFILDESSDSDIELFHYPLTDENSQKTIRKFAKSLVERF